MSSSTPYDAIVIGGGVIGCATAYHLAVDHSLRTLIVERDGIASGASGGAAGELAATELLETGGQPKSRVLTDFLLAGLDLHWNLAPAILEESGIDYLLTEIPMMRPALDENEAAALRAQMDWQADAGIECRWIEPETIRAMGAWLTNDAIGAVFSTEIQLETYPFALALAQATEQHTVDIRTAEATGLVVTNGRVTGVRLRGETVRAQAVVIANGPWAQQTGAWTGFDVPVVPLRGQIVHLDLPPGKRKPAHSIFHETGYLLPKAGGDLLTGTTIEDVGFDTGTTQEAQDSIMANAVRLFPPVIDAPIREITACLRPYSKDELPIIGAVPGCDGLYLATGHGFKGITLSLITGKSLAELIVTNESRFPMDAFAPSRFVEA